MKTSIENVEVMLEQYGNAILRVAVTYVKNRQDAEDILQDVLEKYMMIGPTFANTNHEKAWFLRVAINMAKNKCKSSTFRLRSNWIESGEYYDTYKDNDILKAVYELPLKYKEVIYLYYYEEYSVKEIAELVQKKESTVKSLLNRGRVKLSGALREEYGNEYGHTESL